MDEHSTEYPLQWYEWSTKKRKDYLDRIYKVVTVLAKDPNLKQTQISRLTKIPRQTVNRIINELVGIKAIRKSVYVIASDNKVNSYIQVYRYDVESQFLRFLEQMLGEDHAHKVRPRGFEAAHSPQETEEEQGEPSESPKIGFAEAKIMEMTQEERDEWARNGVFRIHGFQRRWTLKNFTLIDDEDTWYKVGSTLNPDSIENPVRKVKIGRGGKTPSYMILAPSETFRGVKYQLHFKKKALIVSLPDKSAIWIPWDEFRKDLEQVIELDIRAVVEKTIKAYNMWFYQQVLAYDDGWVGKKKTLKPEVGYIDSDGIIRKVYEVEGSTYIEGLGFWIDASLKPAPELEFDSIETASKFKKAVEVLASRELDEKIEFVNEKIDEVRKDIEGKVEEIVVRAVEKAITTAAERLAETSYAGGVTIQQQFTELWKRIAEMQETLQLVVAVTLLKDDEKVGAELKKRLLQKLGMGV